MSRLGNSQKRSGGIDLRASMSRTLFICRTVPQVQQRLLFVIGVIADLKGDLERRGPSPRRRPRNREPRGSYDRTRDFPTHSQR